MRALLLLVAAACKTEAPAPNDVAVASSSVPVIESPPAPSEVPSAPPSSSAKPTSSSLGLPASVAEIPGDWLACTTDAECVAIRSACCGAWPSNVAHRERVRKSVAVADAARDYCKNRMCAQRVETPACDHGKCVIR